MHDHACMGAQLTIRHLLDLKHTDQDNIYVNYSLHFQHQLNLNKTLCLQSLDGIIYIMSSRAPFTQVLYALYQKERICTCI